MVTKARSLRAVEQRTAQMAHKLGRVWGVHRRIADNTFGKVIPRLRFGQLVRCLHRLVKAEHRRGNLQPSHLSVGAVAVDGNHVATLRWHDLCRVLDLDPAQTSAAQLRSLVAQHYPEAQLCEPEGRQPYALMRMHTVTLISSAAAVCVHQRPIGGHTNEIGSMPALIDELKDAYGRMRLFRLVTYHIWCVDLTDAGYLDWTHARQLVRVQRTTDNPTTGEVTVGNRYSVTNRSPAQLSAQRALKLSRAHWRCEDETHWTADAELGEDRRRLAWSRHPHGTLCVSVLRMMALAILAVARRLSRFGHSRETPSWAQVSEHFFLQLCGTIVHTEPFDRV